MCVCVLISGLHANEYISLSRGLLTICICNNYSSEVLIITYFCLMKTYVCLLYCPEHPLSGWSI